MNTSPSLDKRQLDEEEVAELIAAFKGRILNLIPAHRYATTERTAIKNAGSLKMLLKSLDAYLARMKPRQDGTVPFTDMTHTAQISVFRVIQRNLAPIRQELADFMASVVVIEQERE